MDNRIKIGDEWYVKESTIEAGVAIFPVDKVEIDPTFTRGFVVEDDDYVFEFSVIVVDGDVCMPTIEFIDKTGDEWTEPERWDNPVWMRKVLANDATSLKELEEYDLTDVGLQTLKLVIGLAIEDEYLTSY